MKRRRIGIEALERAVSELGGQAVVARICSVGQSAISECLRRGVKVSPEWCLPIEQATAHLPVGQRITRHDLRPDLYPRDASPSANSSERSAAA